MVAEAKVSKGNTKLGPSIVNFSTVPGRPAENGGTCPGASDWCRANCYAERPMRQYRQTAARWGENADAVREGTLPTIPATVTTFRIHVAGDFYDAPYIHAWRFLIQSRPDVTFYAYTRSWRVKALVPALEKLRALPNMQLFASTDLSIVELPPEGWRVAFIDDDARFTGFQCPEQTGAKANCEECGYCFRGQRNNVRFITH